MGHGCTVYNSLPHKSYISVNCNKLNNGSTLRFISLQFCLSWYFQDRGGGASNINLLPTCFFVVQFCFMNPPSYHLVIVIYKYFFGRPMPELALLMASCSARGSGTLRGLGLGELFQSSPDLSQNAVDFIFLKQFND